LQTIDGAMSNIGNLLDRLNTLATQSATDTFTGSRATLQAEFSSTQAEITRQATAVGMNSTGPMVGNLNVVIGGGQTVGGGTVTLGLLGAAVDATSLGLTSNTETGTVALTTNAAVVAAIGANTTATFTFTAPTAVPASYGVPGGVVVTVGLGGVSTQAELLSAVNSAIAQQSLANPDFAAANFSASLNPTGHLTFSTTESIAPDAPTVAGGLGGAVALGFAVAGTAATNAGAIDISSQGGGAAAVATIATSVATLGSAQAAVGKSENVLNYALNLAATQVTNEASSESQIRDADLAQQAANLTKAQILLQAGVAALAQANSAPQAILTLLKT
jgi:flagellin